MLVQRLVQSPLAVLHLHTTQSVVLYGLKYVQSIYRKLFKLLERLLDPWRLVVYRQYGQPLTRDVLATLTAAHVLHKKDFFQMTINCTV